MTIKQIQIPDGEAFIVEQGDRIGWTTEDDISPITASYANNQRVLYRPLNGAPRSIQTLEEFDPGRIFPATFSVGVEVKRKNPNECHTVTGNIRNCALQCIFYPLV